MRVLFVTLCIFRRNMHSITLICVMFLRCSMCQIYTDTLSEHGNYIMCLYFVDFDDGAADQGTKPIKARSAKCCGNSLSSNELSARSFNNLHVPYSYYYNQKVPSLRDALRLLIRWKSVRSWPNRGQHRGADDPNNTLFSAVGVATSVTKRTI